MNRRVFISVSIISLFILFLLNFSISRSASEKLNYFFKHEVHSLISTQTSILTNLVRNDLISGNFMEARSKLAKATVSSRVLACYFLSVDGEKEFLLNTEI